MARNSARKSYISPVFVMIKLRAPPFAQSMSWLIIQGELVALRRASGSSLLEVPCFKHHAAIGNTWFPARVREALLALRVIRGGLAHIGVQGLQDKSPQVGPLLALPDNVTQCPFVPTTMRTSLGIHQSRLLQSDIGPQASGNYRLNPLVLDWVSLQLL